MRNVFIALLFSFITLPALAAELADTDKANLFPLSYADAEEAVSRALADKGAADKVAAKINGRGDNTPLYSYTAPLTVDVRGLRFDKPSGHWSANLLLLANGSVVSALPASGRFDEMVEVPMLKRALNNKNVISTSDIEVRDMPISQTRVDVITDIASLIGKSPVYSVSAYRPIRDHEIATPPLVRKSNIVQMRYLSPGMEITTTGQALDDGAKGTVINVRNLASKKIVQAVVEDSATVSVTGDTRIQSSSNQTADAYAKN